jgi:hypothetical protein
VSFKRSTPALDAAIKAVNEIGGRYELRVEPARDEDASKLAWLAGRGRNFLRITPSLQQSMVRFMRAELEFEPTMSARKLLEAGAQGAKTQVILRFTAQGNDVTLKPLTAQWLARKVARGLDRRIGIATGELLNSLDSARWVLIRRS